MIVADWSLSDFFTWQWLNTEQVIATTSVLTVLLLGGAGIAAFVQIAHAKDARREAARPFVIVDVIGSRAQLFRMEIKNVGRTIARDVTVVFDPPLESTLDTPTRKVRNIPILARGTPSMAPGKGHIFLLDKAPARKSSDLPDTYRVTVSYAGYDETPYSDEQVVDLGVYWDTPDLRERDLHDIWHLLREGKESLHGLHSAVINLAPPPKGDFPPLPRGASPPGSITEMPRSIEGGGYPLGQQEPDDSEE